MKRLVYALFVGVFALNSVQASAQDCGPQENRVNRQASKVASLEKTGEKLQTKLEKNEDRKNLALIRYEDRLATYETKVDEVRATNESRIENLRKEYPLCFNSCRMNLIDNDCKAFCRVRVQNDKRLNKAIQRVEAHKRKLPSIERRYSSKKASIDRAIERHNVKVEDAKKLLQSYQVVLASCLATTPQP